VGFRWNLGHDDVEPRDDIAPDTASTAFSVLGLDFRDGADGARSERPVSSVEAASVVPSSAPTASPMSSSAEDGAVPITRRSLRRAAAETAVSLGEIPAVPIRAEASTPRAAEPAAVSEPSPLVIAAESARQPIHPAAGWRAAVRPRGRGAADRPSASAPRAKKKRHLLSKLMTIGAMLGVGGLMISTSLPANAFYSADFLGGTSAVQAGPAQSLKITQEVTPAVATRDGYTVASLAEQLRLKYGNRSFAYTNDPNGTIQWPFPIPVPISSGFGDRNVPNCGYCSTYHEGVDFTPGAGVAIQAIADGVVSAVINDRGGLGVHVIIDHVINGQKIQSVYAHMLTGSVRVAVGQEVKVTDQVGQVGSTGASTGAHLHLEIHVEGVPVDPFAWLKANAN